MGMNIILPDELCFSLLNDDIEAVVTPQHHVMRAEKQTKRVKSARDLSMSAILTKHTKKKDKI